jgi:hypothetical protein
LRLDEQSTIQVSIQAILPSADQDETEEGWRHGFWSKIPKLGGTQLSER